MCSCFSIAHMISQLPHETEDQERQYDQTKRSLSNPTEISPNWCSILELPMSMMITKHRWLALGWNGTLLIYHTRRKFSLEFNFRYFDNAKLAKFKLRLLLYFKESLNDSLYNWNSKTKVRWYNSVNLTNLSQNAKLNSMYIFILYGTTSI